MQEVIFMFFFSDKKSDAYATITGNEMAPRLKGTVSFYSVHGGTLVVAEFSGLPTNNNFHAFHIHTGSTCENPGLHYNPTDRPHPEHAGDLPPILSANGNAFLSFYTNRFFPEDIIGRTLIIHSNADDFTSQPSGNPGIIVACGVIKETTSF